MKKIKLLLCRSVNVKLGVSVLALVLNAFFLPFDVISQSGNPHGIGIANSDHAIESATILDLGESTANTVFAMLRSESLLVENSIDPNDDESRNYPRKFLAEYYQKVGIEFNHGVSLNSAFENAASLFYNEHQLYQTEFYEHFIDEDNGEVPFDTEFLNIVRAADFSEGNVDDIVLIFDYFSDLVNQ